MRSPKKPDPFVFFDQQQAYRKVVLQAISQFEKLARRLHPAVSQTQHEEAIGELKRKSFDIDSRIADADTFAIVKYFETHPSLDPRILSLRFTDQNTIQITTGVVRGPLSGGGFYYIARREHGRWIVRSKGGWVS
ncbi:hypothetical protein [Stieleria varia]|uniref:hypothetical protein n=1 Tax=Stieleria varia TaxID=2528005 RepID=UPI0011B6C950|nr:hypothetical protein [Stieleria varia]